MKIPKEYLIPIGTYVKVKAFYYVSKAPSDHYNYRYKREFKHEATPVEYIGVIVGVERKYSGYATYGTYEDPPKFVKPKLEYFLQVKLGYLNKPLLTKPEHVTILPKDKSYKLPLLFQYQWNDPNYHPNRYKEYLREIMKEEMKDWPRDKKGRWVKKK